jgi:hypothetical protein
MGTNRGWLELYTALGGWTEMWTTEGEEDDVFVLAEAVEIGQFEVAVVVIVTVAAQLSPG